MNDHKSISIRWLPGVFILAGVALLAALLALSQAGPAQAAPAEQPQAHPVFNQPSNNDACLACHGLPGQVGSYPNTTPYSVTIPVEVYNQSTHANLLCSACHVNFAEIPPHRDLKALNINDERDYVLSYKDSCKECHARQYAELQDSMHTRLLEEQGNLNAPVCADCHNPHTEKKSRDEQGNLLPEARVSIAQTCSKCHDAIFKDYAESVHGRGVLEDNNPDVPTCTDCHGVHTIVDARSAAFRNSSIQLCANCHTDQKLMDKYGLSTAVMNTYVADFHGTTVVLFERQSPDEMTNKPVCYDCHGVHDIMRADDPEKGLQVRTNLLKTCQRCHPDATENFDTSWLSHYIPSPTKYPIVYFVNLVYLILIPTVLGGMAMIIATDVYRKIRTRGKPAHGEDVHDEKGHAEEAHAEEVHAEEAHAEAPVEQKPESGKEE